ncbi:MAG TPA: type II secretion system F family protein [Burkholderiaceae bacterium]|nr:type II secretion system F family protein [Burkholderiaceae bacterium]
MLTPSLDPIFLLFAVAVFVAVVLGFEGLYLWWNSSRGPEARRMERRLRAMSAGGHGSEQLSLLKRRALSDSPAYAQLLLLVPRVGAIDRMLMQSGLTFSVGELVGLTLALAGTGLFAPVLLGRPMWWGVPLAVVLGALPMLYVLRARAKRLIVTERQLPDAIDLMGRALRAGHAFPTALKMVGDEMAEPIGAEFRTLFDEINYGVSLQDALLNLVSRVPSTDLQYFVIAVLIQRESGGNLAELLDNISSIVRARLKLMGQIRTLSAEGRLSAWILGLLPFCTAALINIVNPGFMKVLWEDPIGPNLIAGALTLMAFGVWWMRKIIRIRV